MAAPMPFDAPVTTATLPLSFFAMTLFLHECGSILYWQVKIRRRLWRIQGLFNEWYETLGTSYHLRNVGDIPPPRRRGRPRSFDTDLALHRALEVFRRKGYEGAALSELTDAMGINRSSMYAAFP